MHNLYAIFVKFHDICKQFAGNLVNESGNVPRCGVIPKFSDLEVVALTAETESIDSIKRKAERAARNLDTIQRMVLALIAVWKNRRKKYQISERVRLR